MRVVWSLNVSLSRLSLLIVGVMASSLSLSPKFKLPPVESQALRHSWRNLLALQSDITWWSVSVPVLISPSRSSSLAPSRRRKPLRENSLQDNDGTAAKVPKALDRLPDGAVCICVCACVDNSLAGRMTVWKSWKCLWLHLNMIWSSFTLNLLHSGRRGARESDIMAQNYKSKERKGGGERARGRKDKERVYLHINAFICDLLTAGGSYQKTNAASFKGMLKKQRPSSTSASRSSFLFADSLETSWTNNTVVFLKFKTEIDALTNNGIS